MPRGVVELPSDLVREIAAFYGDRARFYARVGRPAPSVAAVAELLDQLADEADANGKAVL